MIEWIVVSPRPMIVIAGQGGPNDSDSRQMVSNSDSRLKGHDGDSRHTIQPATVTTGIASDSKGKQTANDSDSRHSQQW